MSEHFHEAIEQPINSQETPEKFPSPEEIAELQTRFDAIVDSPLYYGDRTLAKEVDPETQEVTARTITSFLRTNGVMVTSIYDDKITREHRPDEYGAPPFSIDDPISKQSNKFKAIDRELSIAEEKIEAEKAEREAFARQKYGPKLGSITLKLLGIKGPYNRRMKEVEDYRSGVKQYTRRGSAR